MRHTVVSRVQAPHVRVVKSQGGPPQKKASKRSDELLDSNSDSDSASSSDDSCDGESLALAPLVKRELNQGSKRWHSMHMYRLSLVGSAIRKLSYGLSIARDACGVWKVESVLLASLKTDMSRDWSCKSERRRLRFGISCIPCNSMPKLPPPPRALSPPPPHSRMAI